MALCGGLGLLPCVALGLTDPFGVLWGLVRLVVIPAEPRELLA